MPRGRDSQRYTIQEHLKRNPGHSTEMGQLEGSVPDILGGTKEIAIENGHIIARPIQNKPNPLKKICHRHFG